MRTERSFSEGLVELTRARERLQFAIATGRRGARAHAQSGLVAHPGRGLDKSRPSLAPNWVLLTAPPSGVRLLEDVWGPAGAEPAFLRVVGGPPGMLCFLPPAQSATVALVAVFRLNASGPASLKFATCNPDPERRPIRSRPSASLRPLASSGL